MATVHVMTYNFATEMLLDLAFFDCIRCVLFNDLGQIWFMLEDRFSDSRIPKHTFDTHLGGVVLELVCEGTSD